MKFGILRDKFKLKKFPSLSFVFEYRLEILWAKLKGPMGFENEIELAHQYLVCPPFPLVMALILLVIQFIRALICLMGMLFHSSTRALVNWARVAGDGWRCRTCLSNWFHRCSIGDKSGLYGGSRIMLGPA